MDIVDKQLTKSSSSNSFTYIPVSFFLCSSRVYSLLYRTHIHRELEALDQTLYKYIEAGFQKFCNQQKVGSKPETIWDRNTTRDTHIALGLILKSLSLPGI